MLLLHYIGIHAGMHVYAARYAMHDDDENTTCMSQGHAAGQNGS